MKRQMILVPLDGSDRALVAVPYAATMARACGTGVELLTVVHNAGAGEPARRLEALAAQALARHIQGVADRLAAEGLAVESSVRSGDPAAEILVQAEKRRSRAVVMATRGLGGLDRWLIGSVADPVMRLAPCPVLVVRPPTGGRPPVVWRPRRLLVPLDGSPTAETALAPAYELAAALKAEVALVRVQPWTAAQFGLADGYLPDIASLDEAAAHAAGAYLGALRSAAPPGLAVRTVVLRGSPAACLIDFAEADSADLIVMTSHSRSGVGRLLLGSVADRVVRHGLPALIVHPAAAARSELPVAQAAAGDPGRSLPRPQQEQLSCLSLDKMGAWTSATSPGRSRQPDWSSAST